MASFQPFLAEVKSGATGYTQAVQIGAGAATSQTIQINNNSATSVLVTAANATAGTVAYIRMSVESSTSIAATSADTPIIFNGGTAVVRLFASPNIGGVYNVAVIVSATPTAAGTIWFTPGQGGIV